MELSENERMLLFKEKKEISKITSEIFDIYQDSNKKHEVLEKIIQIQNCLSIIASYAPQNRLLQELTLDVIDIDNMYASEGQDLFTQFYIRKYCVFANSITFEFAKKGVKIILPKKIEGSIFKM